MKIKPEHYNHVKQEMAKIPIETVRQHKENLKLDLRVKDLDMRLRWDWFRAAGLHCDVLYKYLDDTHIDTALKKIVKELEV